MGARGFVGASGADTATLGRRLRAGLLGTGAALLLLTGCKEEAPPPAVIRPVRTVVVQTQPVSDPLILTGRVTSQDEVGLAFRFDGKMTDRLVNVGSEITAGQVVARMDPQGQQNAVRAAQADLAATQATLTQAREAEGRIKGLYDKGFATRVQFEAAEQQFQTAQSAVDAATARLNNSKDQLGYAELRSEVDGTVTSVGAQPGEVVRAGQTIIQVARRNGRDAVFDVPAQALRTATPDVPIEVWLSDDPKIRVTAKVREVSPQADPATRTFAVKVSLNNPPPQMQLGSIVTGQATLSTEKAIVVPGTAITAGEGGVPAVWVYDAATQTVQLRPVEVARYETENVIVAGGLKDGDRVITAGVHALRPGQKVRLLGQAS